MEVVERGDLALFDLVEGDTVLLEDIWRVVGLERGGEGGTVVAELPLDLDFDARVGLGVLLGMASHGILRAVFTVLVVPVLENVSCG